MEHNPNLKIHIEEDESQVSLETRLHDVLPVAKVLGQQFSAMTGWVLDYQPTDKARKSFAPDSNLPIFGQFETVDMAANVPANQSALHRGQCDQLVDSINTILRRLEAAELTLWQHQHYSHEVNQAFQDFQFPSNDSDVLANQLRQASQAMNATGAALYLLDDDTTQLNLRATIGPASAARQMQSHRALEHSLADLEALVGNVVTITDPMIGESWKIPEPYQFGICVMLGEPSMPLGTVWFFFEAARQATPQELKLLENLCEKIGIELQSRGKGRKNDMPSPLEQELELTSKLNDCRLPSYAPEVDGWKVAGWTYRQELLAGVFHQWAVTPSGQLSIAVGQVAGPMLPATINANNLRSLINAHREYRHSAKSMVAKLNENVWNNSPGDALASLVYVLIDPETNQLQAVNAGDGGMVFGNRQGIQSIDQFQNPLGADLELAFDQWQADFEEGDTLVLFSQGLRNALSESMSAVNDAELLDEIIKENYGDADAILQAIEDKFFASDFQHVAGDLSVVVLTRNSDPAAAMSMAAAEELQAIENEFANGDADLLSALEDEIAALERLGFVRPNRNVIEPGMIEIEAEQWYKDQDAGSDNDSHYSTGEESGDDNGKAAPGPNANLDSDADSDSTEKSQPSETSNQTHAEDPPSEEDALSDSIDADIIDSADTIAEDEVAKDIKSSQAKSKKAPTRSSGSKSSKSTKKTSSAKRRPKSKRSTAAKAAGKTNKSPASKSPVTKSSATKGKATRKGTANTKAAATKTTAGKTKATTTKKAATKKATKSSTVGTKKTAAKKPAKKKAVTKRSATNSAPTKKTVARKTARAKTASSTAAKTTLKVKRTKTTAAKTTKPKAAKAVTKKKATGTKTSSTKTKKRSAKKSSKK